MYKKINENVYTLVITLLCKTDRIICTCSKLMQLVKYRLNIPYILLKKLSKACRLLPTNNESRIRETAQSL